MTAASPAGRQNALAEETSLYLRQHADNPVDWHPWGPAALELARRLDKPILLSIGYSACHWCHVMAHESFEDPATAALMNAGFVNIKVDREERPDLDRIYQTAHQVMNQAGGGWPLTMFLAPDTQRPFFSGTYFPPEQRYGMPAFRTVLEKVTEFYRTRRGDLQQFGDKLLDVLGQLQPPRDTSPDALSREPLLGLRATLQREFDGQFGGFGEAPKFPQPMNLELLLRLWRSSATGDEPDLQALYMATLTLTRMAEGGLNDQLGGGFCRYSVDPYWMIPHFEKMLYDNAQLLGVYAQAAVATGEPLFRRVAAETADWMQRELGAPQGGFYSTLDADSEGHEGRFYAWTPEQVRDLLEPGQYEVFARRFGLDREANFEGAWHLHSFRSTADIARDLSLDEAAVESADRGRPRHAAAGPRGAGTTGARREDPGGLERHGDRRARPRRSRARARRPGRCRGRGDAVPAPALLAGRPPAGRARRGPLALRGLPRRLRAAGLGPAGAARGALGRGRAGLGDRADRSDARAFRRCGARRILSSRPTTTRR